MSDVINVAAVVGSLRKGSYTRRLVHALAHVAPTGMHVSEVPIGDLALYDQDLDTSDPPAPWRAFRERIGRADAVLFATPEYNRSVPGVLKNAIDVGSRPYGHSAWSGKPAAIVSCSPGALGGFGANHHLRQSLVFLDMPILQQPEAYIGGVDKLVDEAGRFSQDATREFGVKVMAAFEGLIRRHR